MALALAELCKYVLVIATKRKDPLVEQLAGRYKVTVDLKKDVTWATDRTPIDSKLVFWPQFPEKMTAQERARRQAVMIHQALDWADRTGGWAVLVDELMWVCEQLRLEKALNSVWFQGRTQGVSVIACGQRPARVPRLAFSSATYLFIWQTSDKRDLDNLREISAGFPRDLIENSVRTLNSENHEALFIDTLRGEICRVIGPAKV